LEGIRLVYGSETICPSHLKCSASPLKSVFQKQLFIAPSHGTERTVRYYSPEAEVSFCGHATIAAGVVLGETSGDGIFYLSTLVGEVPVSVRSKDGLREASLTSVEPSWAAVPDTVLDEALSHLHWANSELDPHFLPAVAYAGAYHLVLAAATLPRLNTLEYDFEGLKKLMLKENLTTVQLVWRESERVFHARNPFPVGGVVEDPATGAAAAALGGYLRAAGLITPPKTLLIRQGEAMGRPSRLQVDIPIAGGIVVTGTAVPLD
jgi:PhzF family phenazine biosynthesis protein